MRAGARNAFRIPPEPRAQQAVPLGGERPSKQRRSPAVTGARIVGYAGMGGYSEAKPSSRLRGA